MGSQNVLGPTAAQAPTLLAAHLGGFQLWLLLFPPLFPAFEYLFILPCAKPLCLAKFYLLDGAFLFQGLLSSARWRAMCVLFPHSVLTCALFSLGHRSRSSCLSSPRLLNDKLLLWVALVDSCTSTFIHSSSASSGAIPLFIFRYPHVVLGKERDHCPSMTSPSLSLAKAPL